MANPELLIYSALRSLFTRSLPKGRWMLQRIETSTGTGIPDNYFNLLNWGSMWIETKTTEYCVSNEQLNWAFAHILTGGLTYVVTRIKHAQIPAKQGIKHTPTTHHRTPTTSSNPQPHATPYPQLPELFKQGDNCIVSYDQLTNSAQKKSQETLIFLAFDDRMRECSTLGTYLRKFNPDVLPVSDWLTQQVTSR